MIKLIVYMQDGRTFSYEVANTIKAREHAHRIITAGWRNIEGQDMVYYPVHQVLKVKFEMKEKDKLATEYQAK